MNQVERKQATEKADSTAYEQTPFGRRPVRRIRSWMTALAWLAMIPALFIYRRLRRSST